MSDSPPIYEEEWEPGARKEKPKSEEHKGNGQDHPPDDDAPVPAPFSDDALAVEWVARHGENWRYVDQVKRWYKWHGSAWKHNTTVDYFEEARAITRQAIAWPLAQELLRSTAQKNRVNNASMAAAMLRWIKSDPAVRAGADIWDADSMLLGVPGGVYDLTLCKAVEPERGQYITKNTSVAPATGTPQRWLDFLAQVTAGDQDLIDYLHRFAGYCLTGSTKEHALAFLYGTGANGKTVFCETLLHILGGYGLTTGMETLSESKAERHPAEIARLHGARMITAEETSTGGRWNEGRIKRLTGGGTISARMLYENEFEFQMQGKFLIAGNHRPAFRADEAMRRRIHLVPFTVTIPEADRDRDLGAKLRAEAPQILAWMLTGCAAWQDYGLAPGERIREATEAYVVNNDLMGMWLEDRTEQDASIKLYDGKPLFDDFTAWCEHQGETPWKRRTWSEAMIDRGYQIARANSVRGFQGIKLRIGREPFGNAPSN